MKRVSIQKSNELQLVSRQTNIVDLLEMLEQWLSQFQRLQKLQVHAIYLSILFLEKRYMSSNHACLTITIKMLSLVRVRMNWFRFHCFLQLNAQLSNSKGNWMWITFALDVIKRTRLSIILYGRGDGVCCRKVCLMNIGKIKRLILWLF